MAFKFEFPVKLPRWTKDEFDKQRQDYTAKHGYTIHIPGFEDIFKWKQWQEPNADELALYKKGDVDALGEKRFEEIRAIMQKKRERFLKMLASPTPRIAMNAASALTFLDDINDTLGTLGVVARTAARLLPSTAARFLTGPAGWAFTAAQIVGFVSELSGLPWATRRLQHELHAMLNLDPKMKKARLKKLNKLKRLRLSKGEIIEGLQTTDNMFGYGICLGPIVGLIYDIPFGMYRAFQGRKVTVTGLPAPLYWADSVANRFFRGCAQLWYGNPDFTDQELCQSMACMNYATQWQKALVGDNSPLDYIDDPSDIELPIHMPIHPSTIDIIESEVGSVLDYSGWPSTGEKWMSTNDMFDNNADRVIENINNWQDRNKQDMESSVCIQNAMQAGMNSLALLEGDDAVEWTFDTVPLAMLKMLNVGYRFPIDVTPDQLDCFTNQLQAFGQAGIEPDMHDIHRAAFIHCGFELTTEVPERPGPTEEEKEAERQRFLTNFRKWYFEDAWSKVSTICTKAHLLTPYYFALYEKKVSHAVSWLNYYGWPPGEPGNRISRIHPDGRPCYQKYLG